MPELARLGSLIIYTLIRSVVTFNVDLGSKTSATYFR